MTLRMVTRAVILIILGLLAIMTFFPFYMMVTQATHTSEEILTVPPPLARGFTLSATMQKWSAWCRSGGTSPTA